MVLFFLLINIFGVAACVSSDIPRCKISLLLAIIIIILQKKQKTAFIVDNFLFFVYYKVLINLDKIHYDRVWRYHVKIADETFGVVWGEDEDCTVAMAKTA